MHGTIYSTPLPGKTTRQADTETTPTPMVQTYDARQPKAFYAAKPGEAPDEFCYEDPATHKQIEKLIDSNLLKTPAEAVF